MQNIYKAGDQKSYTRIVTPDDIAAFESGTVHELYSTFALGRDAEWCTRLFVLEMKDEDEEGIGTFVNIEHIAPALVGSEILFTATIIEINGREIICSYEATHKQRIIARGKTGQKILKKNRIEELLGKLKLL